MQRYRLQFGIKPPSFNGIIMSVATGDSALVRNCFSVEQMSDQNITSRVRPFRLLLLVFSHYKERLALPSPKGLHPMCGSVSDPIAQCGHQNFCLYRRLPDLFSLTGPYCLRHHHSGRSRFRACFQYQSGPELSLPRTGDRVSRSLS